MNKWSEITLEHLFSHATPVETVFTLVSIVASIVSVYALRDALVDAAVQTAAKVNGPRRMVALNNIHQELLRLCMTGVMVLASISFLFLEPPPPDYLFLPQSLVGLVAWVLVASIIMVKSLIDMSVRRKLQKYAPIEVMTQSVTVAPPPEGATSADIAQAAMTTRAEAARSPDAGRRAYDHAHPSSTIKDVKE